MGGVSSLRHMSQKAPPISPACEAAIAEAARGVYDYFKGAQ